MRSSMMSAFFTEDSGENRALLRARVGLFTGLIAALSGGFFLSGCVVTLLVAPAQLVDVLAHPATQAHLAGTAVAILGWLAAKVPSLWTRTLDLLDAGTMLGISIAFACMAFGSHPGHQGEIIVVLALSWVLVARTALVPSRAIKSAAIAAACMTPVTITTYLAAPEAQLMRAVYVMFWGAVAVITTALISRVIYGLREQVREAMKVGQYTLDERVGAGAMGVVYRASHALLRRPTAIKLLNPERTSPRDVARFEREVQLTSGLTHPNTVSIYDFGRTPAGVFYYAMEYLDGVTLEELVRVDGPQPYRRVVHVLNQCCGALHEAHDAGLVHRDIKPANIILTMRGGARDVVKIVDFGLVKEVATDLPPGATERGTIAGTPHYLAPEAIIDPSTTDGRADLYSLGATAYFLLTGRTVFLGDSLVEVCAKHIHEPPEPPSRWAPSPVPPALDAIILACLEKDPAARPKGAEALGAMLAEGAFPAWTQEDARNWWADRGRAVGHRVRSPLPSTEGSIEIDLRGRGANRADA